MLSEEPSFWEKRKAIYQETMKSPRIQIMMLARKHILRLFLPLSIVSVAIVIFITEVLNQPEMAKIVGFTGIGLSFLYAKIQGNKKAKIEYEENNL